MPHGHSWFDVLLGTFYQNAENPQLLQRCFFLYERARLNARMRNSYPGIKRHQEAYHRHLLANLEVFAPIATATDVLRALHAGMLGAPLEGDGLLETNEGRRAELAHLNEQRESAQAEAETL